LIIGKTGVSAQTNPSFADDQQNGVSPLVNRGPKVHDGTAMDCSRAGFPLLARWLR